MLNASLHKSMVHRHLRGGCNIQSGQSCLDLGYSNYNLTRITWAWVLRITWGLGCNFRCGGDDDGVAITIPTDARGLSQRVLFVSFVISKSGDHHPQEGFIKILAKSKISKEILRTSFYIISGHLLGPSIEFRRLFFNVFHQILAIENLKKHPLILALLVSNISFWLPKYSQQQKNRLVLLLTLPWLLWKQLVGR